VKGQGSSFGHFSSRGLHTLHHFNSFHGIPPGRYLVKGWLPSPLLKKTPFVVPPNSIVTVFSRPYNGARQWGQRSSSGSSIFPFGFFRSFLWPSLFALLLAGGLLYYVNSENGKKYSRERLLKIYRKRVAHPHSMWHSIEDSKKTLIGLAAVNGAVFLLWTVPALYNFMHTWFTHSTARSNPLPMLTSCFSHQGGLHLGFNMLALYSFGIKLHETVGREQFLAIFIGGCMASSLGSHYFHLMTRTPVNSLGASGGVYAVMISSILFYPNSQLALIFFPFVHFSAATILPYIVGFEVIGLTGLWARLIGLNFDHAGHLGGATFGYFYTKFLIDNVGTKKKPQQMHTRRY